MSLKNEVVKGLRIEFYHSEGDSRDWDNLTKMVCFHRNYALGDNHDYNKDDFNSFEELKEQIEKDNEVLLIKPLYLYDHSGVTISTSPFNCHFDSGQVGWVFITKETAELTGVPEESFERQLEGEVDIYDQELRGCVYGFTCYKDGEQKDSCGGFYGDNPNTNGMLDNIEEEYEELLKGCDDLTVHIK